MWLQKAATDDRSVLHQIQTHLMQLLNTRQGSVAYLPDYGMPDLNEIYQQLPESLGFLIENVKKLIERYEPRLNQITVWPYLSNTDDSVVQLQLQAVYSTFPISFETYFYHNGTSVVRTLPN